ncbi:MAG TPA: lasso peptide biosynthesis B2 protein [Pyrinomonadaceae bacterium]
MPSTINQKLRRTTAVTRQAFALVYRQPRRALLIFRMANWLVLFTVMIRLLSMPRALQMISAPVRNRSTNTNEQELASAVDALLATNVFVFRPSCWKRAAVLHRYLALEGIDSTINFGMRKEEDGEMTGHAWLERSGKAILESSPPNYTVTYSFPRN